LLKKKRIQVDGITAKKCGGLLGCIHIPRIENWKYKLSNEGKHLAEA